MATYFESINDALTVQITDDFTSYALWKKGRVTGVSGPASVTTVYAADFPLPASGSTPIVVFDAPPGAGVCVIAQTSRAGRYYFVAYSTNMNSKDPCDYYVYLSAKEPEVSVQAKGLFTLWNAEGRVVYDSEANYLKVLDQFEQHYAAAPIVKSYPVKKVGVVSSRPQWYVDSASSPGGWLAFAGCAVVTGYEGQANRISAGYYRLRATTSGAQFPNANDSSNQRRPATMTAIVCDISNLESIPYDFIT